MEQTIICLLITVTDFEPHSSLIGFYQKECSLVFLRFELLIQPGYFLKNSLFLEPFLASSSL